MVSRVLKDIKSHQSTYLLGSKSCKPSAEYLIVLSLASLLRRLATYSSDM